MKKLILLGGGLDSTTLMVDEYRKGNELYALFFNYNQKAIKGELKSANYFCNTYDIPLTVVKVEINKLANCSILKGSKVGKKGKDNCLEGRNAIFISLATTFCATNGINEILVGFHKEPKEYRFEDAHEGFVNAFNNYVDSYLSKEFKNTIWVNAPYKRKTKYKIFELAQKLDKEIVKKSFSCYENTENECGICIHCLEKEELIKEWKKRNV